MSSTNLKIRATSTFLVLCASTTLWAEPAAETEQSQASKGNPSPTVTHTISNPTGWIARAGELNVALGLDQAFKPTGIASYGLGDIAEFGLVLQRERTDCFECDETFDRTLGTGVFKLGLPEGFWHEHVPGLALVFRKTLPKSLQRFASSRTAISTQETEKPTAFVTAMASKRFGPLALHIGAELLASQEGLDILDAIETPTIRPALGIAYVPPAYPLTTLIADVRWIAARNEIDDMNNQSGEWQAIWNAAWGIRYQALDWAAVDLNLRHQQGEAAGDASATLGVRGTFDLAGSYRKKQ